MVATENPCTQGGNDAGRIAVEGAIDRGLADVPRRRARRAARDADRRSEAAALRRVEPIADLVSWGG